MNSNDENHTCSPQNPSCEPIRLVVRELGHVPSMKNSKHLFLTNSRTSAWMKKVAAAIESQLLCAFRTIESETGTGPLLRSWIVTHLPLDDSLDWIGVPCGSWRRVKKGEEGADIEITPL